MMWPTLIVDNFFDDPDKIINLSKQLKFKRSQSHKWPGSRSPQLDTVDKEFFHWSTKKIMMLLFPMNVGNLKWRAIQHFQKIPYKTYGKSGWIHKDDASEFTVIIYLSRHRKSGTALYTPKKFFVSAIHSDKKIEFYKNPENVRTGEQWRKKANSHFEKVVDLHSNFNRLILFDGNQWHGADSFGTDKEDRLTLITFFVDVAIETSTGGDPLRYPIPMMRRQ